MLPAPFNLIPIFLSVFHFPILYFSRKTFLDDKYENWRSKWKAYANVDTINPTIISICGTASDKIIG
jgi:hypothetical protein